MHQIHPIGFLIALGLLAIVWIFLPDEARLPLAFVLIMGALAATQHPVEYIKAFFAWAYGPHSTVYGAEGSAAPHKMG